MAGVPMSAPRVSIVGAAYQPPRAVVAAPPARSRPPCAPLRHMAQKSPWRRYAAELAARNYDRDSAWPLLQRKFPDCNENQLRKALYNEVAPKWTLSHRRGGALGSGAFKATEAPLGGLALDAAAAAEEASALEAAACSRLELAPAAPSEEQTEALCEPPPEPLPEEQTEAPPEPPEPPPPPPRRQYCHRVHASYLYVLVLGNFAFLSRMVVTHEVDRKLARASAVSA